MTMTTHFKVLSKELFFFCMLASLTAVDAPLRADFVRDLQNHEGYYDPAKLIDDVQSKINGTQNGENRINESEVKDLFESEHKINCMHQIPIDKLANAISIAYITKPNAKLLVENGDAKVSADWVFLSSESYDDVKQCLDTKRLAICSSEEELERLINNVRNLIKANSHLDINSQIAILNLAMQRTFLDDAQRKGYETRLFDAISKDGLGLSYIKSLKSLFTLSGIINASKYTFSKVGDLASYAAKSLVTSPLLMPGIWLCKLIHGQAYEAIFLAAFYELLGERPDSVAILTLALGPAMLGLNMLTSIPDFILNNLGPLSYLSPFTRVVTSLLAYPASISISQILVRLALSALSYIPPLAKLGETTERLIDKLYGCTIKEYVTKSEDRRRDEVMLNKLAEDAEVAKSVSLPHFVEQKIESSILDIARRSEGIKKLSESVAQTIAQKPDLITIASETFQHYDESGTQHHVDTNILEQEGVQASIGYITRILSNFNNSNGRMLSDMDLTSKRNALKSYLKDEITESKELFESYMNESPEERARNIDGYKRSIEILYQISSSYELLLALYAEYSKIPHQNALGEDIEEASPEIKRKWASKVQSIYASNGIQIGSSEAEAYSDFLLSLELPTTNIAAFYTEIAVMLNEFYNQIYSGFLNGVLASMDDADIDVISDFYFSKFVNLEVDDLNALSRVLRIILRGNNILCVGEGLIKFNDEIIPIEDFINDYLIPNKKALLSEFTKEEGEVLSSILYLFDRKGNEEIPQKIRKMFYILCDAHAAKPSQAFISSMLSHLGSFINYNHISEATLAGIITLISASDISDPYGVAFAPGIYWALRSFGYSRYDSFFQTIRLFIINGQMQKIAYLLGKQILVGRRSIVSSIILSQIVAPLLSSRVMEWLERKASDIIQFNNEISKESFINMLNI